MPRRLYLLFLSLWLCLSLLVSGAEISASRARHEGTFLTDARIMHRLLSQRAVQHDAILVTLVTPPDLTGFSGPIRSRDSWLRLWN